MMKRLVDNCPFSVIFIKNRFPLGQKHFLISVRPQALSILSMTSWSFQQWIIAIVNLKYTGVLIWTIIIVYFTQWWLIFLSINTYYWLNE